MIVLPVWKELLQWGPLLLGGAAMGSTVERVLGPCRSWPRRGALYLLLGFTLGLPAWVGDHNPILLFLPFLTVFLLCGGGRPQARLVAGGIFYTLLVPIGMMADTVLKQAINSVSHNGERVGSNLVKLVCWAVLVPVIWKLVRRPVRLSSRLWKLLGGLTLAPLMATLSFSLWGTGMVGDELVDHFVEGIAYTILPFASLSALALLAALAVLSRHEELEEEDRLAVLQTVIRQQLNVAKTEAYIDAYLAKKNAQEPPKRGIRKLIVRDVRLFLNSVNHSLELVRSAGIQAETKQEETDREIVLTIRLPKRAG